MTSAIQVTNLSKTFRAGSRAVDDVSFSVAPGEMVALIGASGSGKSTLLRHVAGLVEADRDVGEGFVTVDNRRIQDRGKIDPDIRSLRRDIGFIFQQFNLIDRLSVLTNVLCGVLGRAPRWRTTFLWFTREEKRLAMECLARVGISGQAQQRASTLSGGQQQRAAIARALAQKARVVLADEPISSLDPASSKNVMEHLAAINRDDGVTVLVSLHQVDYAIRYCPRTIALRDGKIVFDGSSKKLTRAVLTDLYGDSSIELLGEQHETQDFRPPEHLPETPRLAPEAIPA
ncbi:MAG: phosphonate ABC transporter ATP-binding protein [Rhodospirillaceae bacterium]|nr:phosphonate ABC transporter ATP-binding protein [Rhodospirillaceae bacterium]